MIKLCVFFVFLVVSVLGCIELYEYKSTKKESMIYLEDKFSDGNTRCISLSSDLGLATNMNFSISAISQHTRSRIINYKNKKFPDLVYSDGHILFCYETTNKEDHPDNRFVFKISPYITPSHIEVIKIYKDNKRYTLSPKCSNTRDSQNLLINDFIAEMDAPGSKSVDKSKKLYKPIVYINPLTIGGEDSLTTECYLYSKNNKKIGSFYYSTNGKGFDTVKTSYCQGSIIFDKKNENSYCLTNKSVHYLNCSNPRCVLEDDKKSIRFSMSLEQTFHKNFEKDPEYVNGLWNALSVIGECNNAEKFNKKQKREYDYENYSYPDGTSTIPPIYDNIHNKKYFCNNVMVNYQTVCDPSSKCCTDKCLLKKKGDVCSINRTTGDVSTCDGQSETCPVRYTRFSPKQASIKTKKFNINLNTIQSMGRSVFR